ncbi:helix-turn-helix domain-containing protein [Streptomyces botrytidirepellens]|uniref:PucR family transcriptional regulator n=1 Tax=Streptomyces botrytidirepellens TaxID=2486417 RepID=A0A3M8X9J6_9ACTN|nr:helix-turn-helix domain-containing protein [Streptomyces botrytidirepellens]RNG38837.1 PucR family transcriptional regulator [Streptomyces botrytidirepellens]
MLTLGTICGEPDFSLRFAGEHRPADRTVDSVRIVPGTTWSGDALGDVGDALVVIRLPGGSTGQDGHAALERLLRTLARQRAAGLAFAVDRHGPQATPVAVRSWAARLGVPLLTTTRSLEAWHQLIPRLHAYRHRYAEWHADQLTALLNRLPARLADAGPDATQRIADWLAAALDAEVLVSDEQRGVLAASPETASGALAPLLARRTVTPRLPAAPADDALHTRFLPLGSTGPGGGAVLSVGSRRPFDDIAAELMHHAARVLSLIDQAGRQDRAVASAEQGVRLGALQLLMVGDELAAQRVMVGLAPGLLATEHIRVYVVDCGAADREPAARHGETALGGRAMLVRCPAYNHLIVVDPLHDPDPDDGPLSVRSALRQVVAGQPDHRVGGSRVHKLGNVADAYAEALTALVTARQLPDRMALSEERAGLVELLDPDTARRWAATVLHPLLTLPTGRRDRLLRTLDLGLEVQHKAAGRVLGIHRNTVAHRIRQGFDLLGLDRNRVLDKVMVSMALKIVITYGHDETSAEPAADFAAMVSAPEVRVWAESFLKPLKSDRRDLPRTLRAWLENDTQVERTAAALNLSPVTVRGHLRAAAPLIQRDLVVDGDGQEVLEELEEGEQVLGGVRALAFALHVSTGRPELPSARQS